MMTMTMMTTTDDGRPRRQHCVLLLEHRSVIFPMEFWETLGWLGFGCPTSSGWSEHLPNCFLDWEGGGLQNPAEPHLFFRLRRYGYFPADVATTTISDYSQKRKSTEKMLGQKQFRPMKFSYEKCCGPKIFCGRSPTIGDGYRRLLTTADDRRPSSTTIDDCQRSSTTAHDGRRWTDGRRLSAIVHD